MLNMVSNKGTDTCDETRGAWKSVVTQDKRLPKKKLRIVALSCKMCHQIIYLSIFFCTKSHLLPGMNYFLRMYRMCI